MTNKKGHAFMHLQDQFWFNIIENALKLTKGNITEASRDLGIDRDTFKSWMGKLGIQNTYTERTYRKRASDSEEYGTHLKMVMLTSKSIREVCKKMHINHDTFNRHTMKFNLSRDIIGSKL